MRTPPRVSRRLVLGAFALLSIGSAFASEPEGAPVPASLRFESIETAYRFENDGTGSVAFEARIRVLDEAGRASMPQVSIAYASASETARFEWLRTRKANGSVVEADTTASFEVALPITQQAPAYSDLKALVVPVPALSVGDTIEYRAVRTISTPIAPGEFWAIHFPVLGAAVDRETVVLDLPTGRAVRLSSDPGIEVETKEGAGRTIRRFARSAPRGHEETEPPDPPRSIFAVSTFMSFEALGAWYLGLQEGRDGIADGDRALLASLVADRTTPRSRLEAVFAHVASEIRFLSISFGIGGFRPHPATETLTRGYGDCKDKDLVLRALLRAAGIESRPALVSTAYGVLDEAVPIPAQFDHVVTVATIDGRSVWLDASIEVAPPGVLSPGLVGKKAVLVEAGGSRLVEIERGGFVENKERFVTTGSLDASGTLTTESRLEVRGEHEPFFRMMTRGGEPGRKAAAGMLMLRFHTGGATEIPEIESGDAADLTRPFWVRYRGKTTGFVSIATERTEANVPGLYSEVPDRWSSEEVAKRAEGGSIDLEGPWELVVETEIEIDPSWEVSLPAPVTVEKPFGRFESAYAYSGNRLKARRKLVLTASEVPAESRADVVFFGSMLRRDADQRLIVKRRHGVDLSAAAGSLDADALNRAGMEALDAGNPDLAERLLKKATEKDPRHREAWSNLGAAYLDLMRADDAEAALRRHLEIVPEDETVHNSLGNVSVLRGDIEGAIPHFRRHIELDPLEPAAYSNLGRLLMLYGRNEEALAVLERGAEVAPEDGAMHAMYGVLLARVGRTDEARARLERAAGLEMSPLHRVFLPMLLVREGVLLDLADRLARRAMDDTAALVGRVSLDDTPDRYFFHVGVFVAGHLVLGDIARIEGRPEQAVEHLTLAFDLFPSVESAFSLARVLAEAGRFEEALRYYAIGSRRMRSGEPFPGLLGKEATSMPPKLEAWAKKTIGGPGAVAERLETLGRDEMFLRQLKPRSGDFHSPRDLPGDQSVEFAVDVLVDESGAVAEARANGGKEPWTSAALADLKKVRFRPLTGSGRAVRSLRTVQFFYLPGNLVRAYWEFRIDPRTIATFASPAGPGIE